MDVNEEDELQDTLEGWEVEVRKLSYVVDDPELGQFWQWDEPYEGSDLAAVIRVQERKAATSWTGRLVQRSRVVHTDGERSDWSPWKTVGEPGTFWRPGGRKHDWE